jgi:phage shock protein E
MEWAILFIVFDLLAICYLLSATDQVATVDAAQHLRKGAILIDVRTPREYAQSHLPNAINIPVTGIHHLVPMRLRDHNRVLLLHGLTGLRSALAKKMLNDLGYDYVYNLGSYGRAAQITTGR